MKVCQRRYDAREGASTRKDHSCTSKRAAATHLCVPRPKAAAHVTSTTSTTATAMPTHEGHSYPQQRTAATAARVARTSIRSHSGQSSTPQDCVNVFPNRSAAAADASASRMREKVASRAGGEVPQVSGAVALDILCSSDWAVATKPLVAQWQNDHNSMRSGDRNNAQNNTHIANDTL